MRPSNDEYFINIAVAVAARATCGRRQVGAVLVNQHHNIISTAYNSVPTGLPHCPSQQDCGGANEPSGTTNKCIAKHAEEIALIKCPNVYDIHTCYVTTAPCISCVRRLLDTSCKRIVFKANYPGDEAQRLWQQHGYEWRQI